MKKQIPWWKKNFTGHTGTGGARWKIDGRAGRGWRKISRGTGGRGDVGVTGRGPRGMKITCSAHLWREHKTESDIPIWQIINQIFDCNRPFAFLFSFLKIAWLYDWIWKVLRATKNLFCFFLLLFSFSIQLVRLTVNHSMIKVEHSNSQRKYYRSCPFEVLN